MSTAPAPPAKELPVTPLLIQKAIAWAEAQYAAIAQTGLPLDDAQLAMAASVGVQHPDRIRIAEVQRFPVPDDPALKQTAFDTGLLGPDTLGLTLGYGVYVRQGYIGQGHIRQGFSSNRLLSHEFRHVYQYEQAGSISAFLLEYLQQIVMFGYSKAPFEVDARAHEKDHA